MTALEEWIGRGVEREDAMRPWPAQALQAALDLPGPTLDAGDALPPFWRWLYFLEAAPRHALGRDGHPARGRGVSPPVALPRRMWAGGRVTFHRPLILGAPATLVSTVSAITEKQGRTGPLAFVTIRHDVHDADGVVESEEQDLVYREDPSPDAPKPTPPNAPTDETLRREWLTDPTMLFRYSALTFNGHRIHYDLEYARRVEGYDGLVVHGPLLATLMLELLRESGPDRAIDGFSFRAVSPITHEQPFEVCAAPDGDDAFRVWVRATGGRLAMEGRATLAAAGAPA